MTTSNVFISERMNWIEKKFMVKAYNDLFPNGSVFAEDFEAVKKYLRLNFDESEYEFTFTWDYECGTTC